MGLREALTGMVIKAWITWVNGATVGEGDGVGRRAKARSKGASKLEFVHS
jgi:hypothetical protein